MPSSTSSSEPARRDAHTLAEPPRAVAGRPLRTALLVAAALAALVEVGLRLRGYAPTVQDSPELWSLHRQAASEASPRQLLLIGASRIQLDLDLDTLRQETRLEPIQLAIDGGSYVPVLADLAADPAVRGTILVDYVDHVLEGPASDAVSAKWVASHHGRPRAWESPSLAAETWLGHQVRRRLATFADGATAMTSIRTRLLDPDGKKQYIVTRPDRSRIADYSLVEMPEFAIIRALRHLGRADLAAESLTLPEMQARIEQAIASTAPLAPDAAVLARIDAVARDVATIQARGGRVVFVRFPTSGAILAYDRRRYPPALLQTFRERVPAPVVSFDERPALAGFRCPDGSHLDRRDRARFTRALARELAASGMLAATP